MDIVLCNRDGVPVAQSSDYELDLAFGDDENSFDLVLNSGHRLSAGDRFFVDGQEFGGVIERIASDYTKNGKIVTYSGRTWHGLLATKIVAPNSGQDYLTLSGDMNTIIATLITRCGLSEIFKAETEPSGIVTSGYQFARYINAYEAMRACLLSKDAKLCMEYKDGFVWLSALPVEHYSNVVDSDILEFSIEKDYRPVNHIVCLGSGELRDRVVVNLYWNAQTKSVQQSPYFTGIEEVAEIYDYNNASRDELIEKGTEKLEEYQQGGSVSFDLSQDYIFDIGDTVTAQDNENNLTVTAMVNKKIVTVRNGVSSIDYEVGF